MTDQEVFEAWYSEYLSNNTEYPRNQDIWHAAIAYLRSQQKPVAWARSDTVFGWKGQLMNVAWMFPSDKGLINPIPLYLAPQPAIPDGWKPIETAPKGGLFLVHRNHTAYPIVARWDESHGAIEDFIFGELLHGVTHWMPLPAAPEYKKCPAMTPTQPPDAPSSEPLLPLDRR